MALPYVDSIEWPQASAAAKAAASAALLASRRCRMTSPKPVIRVNAIRATIPTATLRYGRMLPRCDASARLRNAIVSHGEMRSIEGGLSAVLDGDVGEAVGETGAEMRGGEVVKGDGVAAGVGPDDADGGGAGLDEGGECELGEGDVGLEVGVAVVGGVDALASGQEGQPVGGVGCGFLAAVLAPGVG